MILDQFKLDGKVALVTGSARGIGQACAIALAQAGADVALVYNRTPADETAQAIRSAGRRAEAFQADLGAGADVARELVTRIAEAFHGVDILVNNAGIIRRAPFTEHRAQDWEEVLAVNLSAPFYLSQAVARRMIAQGRGGKIIHIASMLSFQGGVLVPGYAASKGGIRSLTMLMANELAPHKICTNAIAPGYIATENTRPLREDPARNQAILSRIPAGRWGTPEDLMAAVVFLAAPASDYLNGHTLAVDGGWLAR